MTQDFSESMKDIERVALETITERNRMREALENILALTANPTLIFKEIHEQARKGLGEL